MTQQASDTRELRDAFVNEFMWMTDVDTKDMSMEDILDMYDMELGIAKQKYGPNFNADAQWSEADRWLAQHDYYDTTE